MNPTAASDIVAQIASIASATTPNVIDERRARPTIIWRTLLLITRCGAALILNVPDDAADTGYIEALIWRNWAGGLVMSQLEF